MFVRKRYESSRIHVVVLMCWELAVQSSLLPANENDRICWMQINQRHERHLTAADVTVPKRMKIVEL